jgi:hypothetical protein
MRATYPAHLDLLNFIILIFGEDYKLRRLSVCNLIHPPIISPEPCSQTPSNYTFPTTCDIKFHAQSKQEIKLFIIYFHLPFLSPF